MRKGRADHPGRRSRSLLAELIAEFGPASKTGRVQSAPYPFTRLRADGVWQLDQDVPMDAVTPLGAHHVVGRFEPALEAALWQDPQRILAAARALVVSNFPDTVGPDVLQAAGLDPDSVGLARSSLPVVIDEGQLRRRDPRWRSAVLQAWDRQCAFCGYNGQVAGACAGIDAAHVRWFAFDGPDEADNGLAPCMLHHKLFDLGALGLDQALRGVVSTAFSARTEAGRAVYELHGRAVRPRPGTEVPAKDHLRWHTREVFKGRALAAWPDSLAPAFPV